jgi:isopropylmalate/homocitrate/citramalate synthase
MVKRVFVLILLSVLIGCATQTTAPKMPEFTTEQAKDCARECQAAYAECVNACSQIGATTARQRKECFDYCSQMLIDCYKTCE